MPTQGECDEVIAKATEAIRLDPLYALAYSNRGGACIKQCEYDRAIADFTDAIRLYPDEAYAKLAFDGRSRAWSELGEHDKAIADCDEVIRLDPQNAKAYHSRGVNWHKKGENQKAIADYSEAIRLDPQDDRGYNNRGVAWTRSGNDQEAIADYTQALRLDPENAFRYGALAWLLATCRDGKHRNGAEAVRLAVKACELTDYTDVRYLSCLATAHAERGNFVDAVAWQRKTLELAAPDEMAEMRRRLELYEVGKPYRED